MKKWIGIGLVAFLAMNGVVHATEEDRLAVLEKQVQELLAEREQVQDLLDEREMSMDATAEESKFSIGGYGEIHANFEENGKSMFDIHRLVLYAGYEFSDWIKLNSEIELEHASTDEAYLLIEQLFVDFQLSQAFNVRAGRVLAPMGIVNIRHEPPLFNGVERPNVEKYIIPTTWSFDGIGVFGAPAEWLSYEAYFGAGLDQSEFSGDEGVRDGRMKGRPGLNDAAVIGRVDFYPLVNVDPTIEQDLRIGISGVYAGTENMNKGGSHPGSVENTFSMVSADFEYDISRVEFRGVVALGANSDADDLNAVYGNDVGDEIFGWYLEMGVRSLPESWKKGKFSQAEVIPFVRYEEYNTQHEVTGFVANPDNDKTEITFGVNVELTSNFVLKADYQVMDSAGAARNNKFNLGLGFSFN